MWVLLTLADCDGGQVALGDDTANGDDTLRPHGS